MSQESICKKRLHKNTLQAAKERIAFVFDEFDKIYLSFSGGKDSSVMFHLVMEEAIKRNRKVGILFVDWECQFSMTITHIERMFSLYEKNIELFWVQLPMTTWNGCSMFEPEWTAWDEQKKDLWIRKKSKLAITDPSYFPFYFPSMTWDEFLPLFSEWYSEGELCANFVGIRAQESLNRFRAIAREISRYKEKKWTTNPIGNTWNIYPIYDWTTEDDWVYVAKHKKIYNPLYEYMHKAGMTIHQMRIDEPFGDTQRQSLWLYHIVEPETWAKMVSRVAGANSGALYCGDGGNILGNKKISLPPGHTWETFVKFLLGTMPVPTSEHYKNKIAVYLQWYKTRGYPENIPDEAPRKLETANKVPSWRRICKTLLRNDYWCRNIGFSPTKSAAYQKYLALMRKRRKKWDLFSDIKDY